LRIHIIELYYSADHLIEKDLSMKHSMYLLLLGSLVLSSCSDNTTENDVVIFSDNSDSAIAIIQEADSLSSVRHSAYRGKHLHQGDAAVQSHQDVPKMRRMQRNEALNYDSRVEAYRSESVQREERMRKAMERISDSTEVDTSK